MTLKFFPSEHNVPFGAKVAKGASPKRTIAAPEWLKAEVDQTRDTGELEHSIEVNVPVEKAFGRWTDFERLPDFLDGVDEIRILGGDRLKWVSALGGKRVEWDAEVTEKIPNQRVAWHGLEGSQNAGVITFEVIDPQRTRLNVRMVTEGNWLGPDLDQFKELVENEK